MFDNHWAKCVIATTGKLTVCWRASANKKSRQSFISLALGKRDSVMTGIFPSERSSNGHSFPYHDVIINPHVSGDAVNTVIRCGHDCGVISSASSVTTVALDRTNDGDKTFYDELQVIDQTSRSQSVSIDTHYLRNSSVIRWNIIIDTTVIPD